MLHRRNVGDAKRELAHSILRTLATDGSPTQISLRDAAVGIVEQAFSELPVDAFKFPQGIEAKAKQAMSHN